MREESIPEVPGMEPEPAKYHKKEVAKIPFCFFDEEYETVEGPTAICNRNGIRHSVHKLSNMAQMINGKHIYDAQNILNNETKKAADIF